MTNDYRLCRVWLTALVGLLTTISALAQSITGRVTDAATGQGLAGVSVLAMGTQQGATTNATGDYTLSLEPRQYTIRFSFIGFAPADRSVTIAGTTSQTLNVELAVGASSLSEIVVIGSRAATARTNIQSAVPVDVISTKELKSFGQVDVSQILNYIAPSFNSNRQTVTDGTDHVDPASLRGLGPDQVLVLVNGKRRHTSALININGSVGRGAVGTDMNVIPVAAIERIEVLRDGAAAQYGSDAIAGVINVVLKKNYSGLTASVTGGQNFTTMNYAVPILGGGSSQRSQSIQDGSVLQFDFNKGFRLGKSGALSVSGQVIDRGRSNRSGEDNAPTIYLGASGGFPGPAVLPLTGRPKLLTDDAQLVQQRGYNRRNMVIGNSSARNYGLFVNGDLPVGTKSSLYFAGGVTYRTGTGFGNNRVPVSRAQQPLNADGSLFYPDGFLPAIQSIINDQSLITGYKTRLGNLSIDLSNTFGRNSFRFDVLNSGNASLPSTNTPQTDFYAGTLKFDQNTTNLDLSLPVSELGSLRGLNIAVGGEYRRDHFEIEAGELNSYTGTGRTVPLAPLTVGGPSSGTTSAGPGAQVFPGYQQSDATDKRRRNFSAYADIEGELFDRLLIDVAGRYENYSDFGSKFTGKLAARLRIIDAFSVRGAISTGFRAPSLQQRYFQNTSTQFIAGDPSNTLTINNDSPIARQVIGVDALRPETSVNYTLGVTSKIGRGFTLTVDAYQITIQDRVLYSGAFSRTLLGFTPTDFPGVNVVRFFANAADTRTRGIDIVATERVKVGPGQLTLTAAMNFNRNSVTSINATPLINDPRNNEGRGGSPDTWFRNIFFDRSQVALLETGQPQNKVNLSASYAVGKLDIMLRGVRFGSVTNLTNADPYARNPTTGAFFNAQFSRDETGRPHIDQTFSPIIVTDLTLGYRITKAFYLAVGANNLLDVYPNQLYIDPRNATGSLDYASGRDMSNRGRFLFPTNQGGFNGRFLFGRLSYTMP
ncbi:MAG: TonB-dependent receptor [Bacteroidetes bacterium]|nr:TonB-dependent receptor [Fibrella sp.]